MKYVRWMGAFWGSANNLYRCLSFEITRGGEAACEPMCKRNGRYISNIAPYTIGIGVLLSEKSIFRTFRKDCYSVPVGKGKHRHLIAGKLNLDSNHAEAWARMQGSVQGIVVYGNLENHPKRVREAVEKAARDHDLPIVILTLKGEFKVIEL